MMKRVTRLELINHGAIRIVIRRYVFNGVVNVWIEFFADRFDPMHSLLCEQIPELFSNQFESLAVIFVRGIVVCGESPIETVQDRKKLFD